MEVNIQGFNYIVFLMVGDVPIDSKASVMTPSILRIYWPVFGFTWMSS